MAIASANLITKQDLVDRFNTRVRDYVAANTNWIASTGVFDTNVGVVTANSTAYGGALNRTTQTTASPAGIALTDFTDPIGAQPSAGEIVTSIRAFMQLYANNHQITLVNTGNLAPASYVGNARLNGAPAATITNVNNDVTAAATANGLTNGTVINAANVFNFIETCRGIWSSRCVGVSQESFSYSYCHSSCHSNVTCYNSRGRR